MATADALNVKETVMIDKTIRSFQYRQCEPATRASLNTAGNIIIDVVQHDSFTLPSKAYLFFEGRLLKANGTSYADTDVVTLTHNGLMHLFNSISYNLSDREIESVSHPGQATPMFGMLKHPNDFQLAQRLSQLWVKDSGTTASLTDNNGFAIRQAHIIKNSDPKSSFAFIVPLKHIFGFCDDFDKVIFGFKHTIIFNRKLEDEAIFRGPNAVDGKVELSKLSLLICDSTK